MSPRLFKKQEDSCWQQNACAQCLSNNTLRVSQKCQNPTWLVLPNVLPTYNFFKRDLQQIQLIKLLKYRYHSYKNDHECSEHSPLGGRITVWLIQLTRLDVTKKIFCYLCAVKNFESKLVKLETSHSVILKVFSAFMSIRQRWNI